MSSAQKIPWPRIAVEGVAIIASILIAFSIDAWCADRLDRAEESNLLVLLQDELKNNVSLIESSLEFRQAVSSAATELLEAAAKNEQIPPTELDQLMGILMRGNTTDLSTGALFNLVQGGKLDLVEQELLRPRIASLSAEYDWLRLLEQISIDGLTDFLYPYLVTNAAFGQLHNASPPRPGTVSDPFIAIPTGALRNHEYLLEDDEFVGIVAMTYITQKDLIATLTRLREILRERIVEIETILADK